MIKVMVDGREWSGGVELRLTSGAEAPPSAGWHRVESPGRTRLVYAGGWTPTMGEPKLLRSLDPTAAVERMVVRIAFEAPDESWGDASLSWVVGKRWRRDLLANLLARDDRTVRVNSAEISPYDMPGKARRKDEITYEWQRGGKMTVAVGIHPPTAVKSLVEFPAHAVFGLGHDGEDERHSCGWTFSEIEIEMVYSS